MLLTFVDTDYTLAGAGYTNVGRCQRAQIKRLDSAESTPKMSEAEQRLTFAYSHPLLNPLSSIVKLSGDSYWCIFLYAHYVLLGRRVISVLNAALISR